MREVKGWGECYWIVGGGMEKKCGMDSGVGIPKNPLKIEGVLGSPVPLAQKPSFSPTLVF